MSLDQQLVERVLNSPQLPSLPAIALDIIRLVQEDEVNVDKIAQTISLDPALSSKMLETVNSSFYGLPKSVGSLQQAVIVLGLNSVKTLALGFTLVSNLTSAGGDNFDHMAFWRRSLFSATAAKELCDRLHIVQAEEVFMASLLQDVGVLALAQVLGPEYAKIIRQTGGDHGKLSAAEREALGGDHTEIGAALAESWSLPPLLVESIRLHERPDEAPENMASLIKTVSAGAFAAELIESPDDAERVAAFHRVAKQWFELEENDVEQLIRAVFKQANETQRLFNLPAGDLGYPDDILSRANRTLESVSLGFAKENHELKQANEELRQHASVDPVTGLSNRRRFDERLDEAFLTSDAQSPLSVIFIDLDGFKKVNDTHGHHAGDTLLKSISLAMTASVGDRGEVYRYGGDEFTLICNGLGRTEAALLGETLRVCIEQAACRVSDDHALSVSLTASIGVACYEGSVFKRPEQLVKAADKAAYAAKGGGRNSVRVFVPRVKSDPKAA